MKHFPGNILRQFTYRFLPVVLLQVILIANANAQSGAKQTEISATASRNSVRVAEPFSLEIRCTAPFGSKVVFPVEVNQIGDFEVIESRDEFDVPSSDSQEMRTWTRKMTLESIVTGQLEIPSLEVQVSVTGKYKGLLTKSLQISVVSVLEDRPDPAKFRDLKPLVDVEVPVETSSSWVWWAGGLAGLSLLSAGALLFATRVRKRLKPVQWAVGELNKIENDSRNQVANAEELVTDRVAAVVRDYLEMEFAISAPTQTTAEVAETVRKHNLVDQETQRKLAGLFSLADQAKYAGLDLTNDEVENAIQEAHGVVRLIGESRRTRDRT